MSNAGADDATANRLGSFLKSERNGLKMSLRDVESATNGEVSNAYLSQLENGKITKPSPHILYSLSAALNIDYENLMERAGYIMKPKDSYQGEKHGKAATYAIDNLTQEEEDVLRDYLNFIRTKKRT
ncbi:helix-turn-helix domain-containing protein [Roseibium album]|uniref:helix-turn-helix domain-containing protein n=1 Tax=Roseibium album TaxID=311410 RepID=UPI002492DDB5|nr:helix-turn-helix transcriptional regulator [Roseibium album]